MEPEPLQGIEAEPTPVCPRCLVPVDARRHYCANCGWDTGQFTPYLPFESVPWFADRYAALLQRLCGVDERRWWHRVGLLILTTLCAPLLLLLAPFVLWQRWRNSERRHRQA